VDAELAQGHGYNEIEQAITLDVRPLQKPLKPWNNRPLSVTMAQIHQQVAAWLQDHREL